MNYEIEYIDEYIGVFNGGNIIVIDGGGKQSDYTAVLANPEIVSIDYPQFNATTTSTQTGYIQSLPFDGTQYINVEYRATNNTKIEIVFKQSEYGKFLFGSRAGASSDDAFAFAAFATGTYPQFGSFQSFVGGDTVSLDDTHTLVMSQDGSVLDGTTLKSFNTMDFTSECDMYVGTRNQSGTLDSRMFVGEISSVKIYESDALTAALYPYNNGKSDGFVDVVRGGFYPMQGGSSVSSLSAKLLSKVSTIDKQQPIIGDTMTEEEKAYELQ